MINAQNSLKLKTNQNVFMMFASSAQDFLGNCTNTRVNPPPVPGNSPARASCRMSSRDVGPSPSVRCPAMMRTGGISLLHLAPKRGWETKGHEAEHRLKEPRTMPGVFWGEVANIEQ